MNSLRRQLEADSIGLTATIAEIAALIGLPEREQQIIARLASGRNVTVTSKD